MSEAVAELTSKVDFDMGRRDFKFFFEDICGFQLAHFHDEWYETAYGGWPTIPAQRSSSSATASTSR